MLGNLCRLRQVSHASVEADVALVGDLSHVWRRDEAESDTEVSFVEMHSGLDTSSVPGDVEFICVHASSSCFSGNSTAECHACADTWYQKKAHGYVCFSCELQTVALDNRHLRAASLKGQGMK